MGSRENFGFFWFRFCFRAECPGSSDYAPAPGRMVCNSVGALALALAASLALAQARAPAPNHCRGNLARLGADSREVSRMRLKLQPQVPKYSSGFASGKMFQLR